MPKPPGFATVIYAEAVLPIHLRPIAGGVVTLARARALRASLEKAIRAIDRHFACPVPWSVFGSSTTCGSRGSVKIDGVWYCKRHAKKLTPKPSKAELRAARLIAAADDARTLLSPAGTRGGGAG